MPGRRRFESCCALAPNGGRRGLGGVRLLSLGRLDRARIKAVPRAGPGQARAEFEPGRDVMPGDSKPPTTVYVGPSPRAWLTLR